MGFSETYHYYIVEIADPRTSDWFLVGSPVAPLLCVFCYLYFVLVCGPKYMKDKEAYSLKGFIKCYNVFQIIFNAWIVYSLIQAGWFTTISLGCEPVDYSMNPMALKLCHVSYWAYMLKLVDLLETGVFVLRKKNRQISWLHLYHHVTTFMIGYLGVKYIAGGMATFTTLLNCTIHVIMYTYYFCSTYGGILEKLANACKPYITIMQMVQFVILFVHTTQALLPSCPVPKFPAIGMIPNLILNFFLFYNFYQKNYVKKSKTK